jgi:hypothetical protein
MFQQDNALLHVTRICTQFLEAENVPVLPCPAYSPDIPAISSNFTQPLKRSGTTVHRPQSTA